jgi:hypothetical protein
MTKIEQCEKESLCAPRRYFDRLFNFNSSLEESAEDKKASIASDAQKTSAHVADQLPDCSEPTLDLLDNRACSGTAQPLAQAVSRTRGVFVLDEHAAIDRIDLPAQQQEFMLSFDRDLKVSPNSFELPFEGNSYLLFAPRRIGRSTKCNREPLRMAFDCCRPRVKQSGCVFVDGAARHSSRHGWRLPESEQFIPIVAAAPTLLFRLLALAGGFAAALRFLPHP